MKINEKHLSSFAIGNAASDKEGFLMKKGEVNRSFQKRWFILKGNLLFYLEKKGDKEPIGVIILEGCTVEMTEDPEAFTFELVFAGSGCRTYVLSASTQEEMESWMRALACASYDNMKHMVNVLQSELDEINQRRSVGATQSHLVADTAPISVSQPVPQEVLVNLGEDEPDVRHKSRVNPFDNITATLRKDESLDIFGATPFNPVKPTNRIFEQMHHRFGVYIEKKMND